ncbi:hypothetical protein GCM10022393_07420 [Aquimarina addita]|uniref:Uncharacterized protein n=2 Tax=Aquimarina addita TaxID=870485 RepID=A0ABP7XCK3_9FLAO
MCVITVIACARTVDPTIENINKIFTSKDFTFEFHKKEAPSASLSFRDDYLVFKSDQPTIRRVITYDEVVLINNFIQNIVNLHSETLDKKSSSYYVIKNTAYKTVVIPDQEDFYFEALLKTLDLY